MLWVGIDEAGYGPNLGPLVMTAVVAEGPAGGRPDVWGDLAEVVCRAGGDPGRIWVDDSKKVHSAAKGPGRLEASALAVIESVGTGGSGTISGLLGGLGTGLVEAEWDRWLPVGADPVVPRFQTGPCVRLPVPDRGGWRLVAVRSVVVGPERFNRGLEAAASKAVVHFGAFAELLRWVWGLLPEGGAADVRGDKHGGRTFYAGPLADAFPDSWIDRGEEGPGASRYAIRSGGRRVDLELRPRADADDGLVAMASIVSKYVREAWMADFNAYWCERVAGLNPCAGYPNDARRWRELAGPAAEEMGWPAEVWWRAK